MVLATRHIPLSAALLVDPADQKPGQGVSKDTRLAQKDDARDYIWDQVYPDTLRSDIADLLAYFTGSGRSPKTEVRGDILRASLAIGQFFEHALGGTMPAQSRNVRTHLTTWIADFAEYTGTTHVGLGIQGMPYSASAVPPAAQVDGQHFAVPLHPDINETQIMLGGQTSSVRLDLKMQGGMNQSARTFTEHTHTSLSALLFSGESIRMDDVYKNKMHGMRPDIHLLRTLGADITLYSGVVEGMAALLENPSAMTPDLMHGLMTFTDRMSDIHALVLKNGLDPSGALLSSDLMTTWQAQDIAVLKGLIAQMTELMGQKNVSPALVLAFSNDIVPLLPQGMDPAIATSLNMMTQTAAQHIMTPPPSFDPVLWAGAAGSALSHAFGQNGGGAAITISPSAAAMQAANDAVFAGPAIGAGTSATSLSSSPDGTVSAAPTVVSSSPASPESQIIGPADMPTASARHTAQEKREAADFAAIALATGLMVREPDMTAAPSPIPAQTSFEPLEAPRASPESAHISMPAAAVIPDIPVVAVSDTQNQPGGQIHNTPDPSSPAPQNDDTSSAKAAPVTDTRHPDSSPPAPVMMGTDTPNPAAPADSITPPSIEGAAAPTHSPVSTNMDESKTARAHDVNSFSADTPKSNMADTALAASMFSHTPGDHQTGIAPEGKNTPVIGEHADPSRSRPASNDSDVCARTGKKGCNCSAAFNGAADPNHARAPEMQERIEKERHAFRKTEEEIFGPSTRMQQISEETLRKLTEAAEATGGKQESVSGIFHVCSKDCEHERGTNHPTEDIQTQKAHTVDNPEDLSALLKNRTQGRGRRSARKNDETPSPIS